MPPNIGHLTTTPYCLLHKQECHSLNLLWGDILFQGPEYLCFLSVASYSWYRNIENLTRKLLVLNGVGEYFILAR